MLGLLGITGGVSTLADTNAYAFSTLAGAAPGAVDAAGNAARFNEPGAVAVDAAGNVFVADVHNYTIRKITWDASVTTLAGLAGAPGDADGVGGAARFNGLGGVAVDSAGNVYVTDSGNNTVRKITPNRAVTTLAGLAGVDGSADGVGSAARFDLPRGIAVDSAGVVYVADSYNQTIRKISPTGTVSTLAGSAGVAGTADGTGSAARFNNPWGVAVDSAGTVYVGDYGNHAIRRITAEGVVTTLAGSPASWGSLDGTGSAARFNWPAGVAVDSAGNVYVGDTENGTYNGTIRKVTPDGQVTTLAGQAGTTGSTDGMGSTARFSGPLGVAVDTAGNVYVGDNWNCTVRRITPAGNVTTLAGLPAGPALVDGVGSAGRFNSPSGVAIDSAGTLYVADSVNGAIRKLTANGVVTTLAQGQAGTNGMGTPFYPTGLTVDSSGVVYVTDAAMNTVTKITPNGQMTTLAGMAGQPGSADGTGSEARFRGPSGVAVDHGGNLYVADAANQTVRKITPTGTVTTLAGLAGSIGNADGTNDMARFNSPSGVAINSAGTLLYVVDFWNNTIRQVTLDGAVTTLTAVAGGPSGVAVNSAGDIYVVEYQNDVVVRVTAGGAVTTLAGAPGQFGAVDGVGNAVRFFYPRGIAVDAAGTLYVSDNGNNTIRKGVPSLPDQPVVQQTPALAQARVSDTTRRPAGKVRPASQSVQVGQALTLGTTPQTATTWFWQLVRRPVGSAAQLSSTITSNPTFTPDVADLYLFELRAGDAAGSLAIRTLMFTVAASPLHLSPVGLAGNAFSISVPSASGSSYVLEYTDALSTTNWSALPAVPGTGAMVTLTDPAATSAQRFYRVRTTVP